MRRLYERDARSQMNFVYLIGIAVILGTFLSCMIELRETRAILIENNERIASALLEQGYDSEVIGKAILNARISSEGMNLVRQIGLTTETSFWIWNTTKQAAFIYLGKTIPIMILVCLFLVIGTRYFLNKREQLYEDALENIKQFQEGHYEVHLARNQTGTLYHLFAAIDQLAMALKSQNEREHQAKEFLKDTLSDISHQLKTPLAALNMYNEIILDDLKNQKVVKDFALKSQESLARMERLILTLLKIMRMDAGSISFEKEDCEIAQLVEESITDLRVRVIQEKKEIILDGSDKDTLFCDRDWTKEAIGNLVKNAIDHTDVGGKIKISWQQSPAMMRIMVSDNGNGISEDDIHYIFKRFYRSKKSSDLQGVGLGLPLAKAITEGQGGTIFVQSEVSKGTTFYLSFTKQDN